MLLCYYQYYLTDVGYDLIISLLDDPEYNINFVNDEGDTIQTFFPVQTGL